MEKLRIDSGVKKIEVNDEGEFICIPVNDSMFYERFKGFLDWLEYKNGELKAKESGTPEKDAENVEKRVLDIRDIVTASTELSREVCVELDKLFGEGCCRKVFYGVEVPTLDLIDDFLTEVTPLLQKFANERNEKIRLKYNSRRKGANSK